MIGVTQGDCKESLNDFFVVQRREHLEVGLIDFESEAIFSTALMRFKDKWNNLERSFIAQGSPPKFYDWFLKYKVSDNHHMRSTRSKEMRWYGEYLSLHNQYK